jgi:hypothetical protein
MNVFLPYPDFQKSAQCLDPQRLGNQLNECRVIISSLEKRHVGWTHHPAVVMFDGFTDALKAFSNEVVDEINRRTGRRFFPKFSLPESFRLPPWVGHPDFHSVMRGNLLRKNFPWYSRYQWTDPTALGYLWPVNNEDGTFFFRDLRRVMDVETYLKNMGLK